MVVEHEAFIGKAIEIRCLNKWMTIRAAELRRLLIRHYKEEVRLIRHIILFFFQPGKSGGDVELSELSSCAERPIHP